MKDVGLNEVSFGHVKEHGMEKQNNADVTSQGMA